MTAQPGGATGKALHILLIGCGRMGGALLDGWLRGDQIDKVTVIDPAATPPDDPRISHFSALGQTPSILAPDIALLAVKPQGLSAALEQLAPKLAAEVPVLSVIAGKAVADFHNLMGRDRPVIRAMPNTPAAVGAGVTVCCAGVGVNAAQRELASLLLRAGGAVEWVEDEALMDAVTAVSGSGPAYLFLLIEALEEAAIAQGLPAALSARLARQTVIGAAKLVDASPDSPTALRKAVMSPGGTTEAAMAVLMAENGLAALLREAVSAARTRSEELS